MLSTTITVASWQPAAADISGLTRIAVVQFEGPDELTRAIQAEISQTLVASGAYQLCDPAPIQGAMAPWQGRSPEKVHAALHVARQMQLDAVLIGKVRRRTDYGTNLGAMYVRIGDPELAVNVDYELIDVSSGDVRAGESLSHHYNGEVAAGDSSRDSEKRILARLTDKCLQQLVATVAPHESRTRVELASGSLGIASGNLRSGNAAAAKGDWEAARREWQTVIGANPDSHAAHYNLGVAMEINGEFTTAAAAYQEANRRAPRALYRDALARVQRSALDQQLVATQRSLQHQVASRPSLPPPTYSQPATWHSPAQNPTPPAGQPPETFSPGPRP